MTISTIGRLFLNEMSVNRSNNEMILFFQLQLDKLEGHTVIIDGKETWVEILGKGQDGVRCINMCVGESYVQPGTTCCATYTRPAVAHGPDERFAEGSLVQGWRDNVPSATKFQISKLVVILIKEIPNLDWSQEADLYRDYNVVVKGKTVQLQLDEDEKAEVKNTSIDHIDLW